MSLDLHALLAMGESEYQRWLQERLEASGSLGDVFPLMVSRNVPQYLLRKLWPEVWARFEANPHVIMFGAAEEGWRGRLDNLQARCVADGAGAFRLSFRKTYVMECESLLVLARPGADPVGSSDSDGVALAWIERPQNALRETKAEAGSVDRSESGSREGQTWTRRDEAGLSMHRSEGPPVHHYIVEGDLVIPAERVLFVSRRNYATVATQLPRREITSMALLAAATLRRTDGIPAVSASLRENEERLLKSRDGARLSGAHMQLARDILAEFSQVMGENRVELHPLWDRIRGMAEQAR